MIDTISREDAIAVIRKNHYRLQGKGMTEEVLIADLEALPSAEPKTGKWIEDIKTEKEYQLMFHKVFVCSECGEKECRPKGTKFCPNCGARMLNGGE